MSKGDSKKEMLERFKQLGIPMPMEPVKNAPKTAANPEVASKLDEIRNGGLKNQYAKFIEKEGSPKSSSNLPPPKVGNKQGNNAPKEQAFSKPKSSSNNEAQMLESILYGDSTSSNAYSTNEVSEFGPSNVDTRSILKKRLEEKQNQVNQSNEYTQYSSANKNSSTLNEEELENKIISIATEVAQRISKNMIKQVLMEYAKTGNGIILESKTVKKAEVVGKNTVKIGGKIFKLTPVSE